MFYCKECKEAHSYPETITRSFGSCEICGDEALCYDSPAAVLAHLDSVDAIEEFPLNLRIAIKPAFPHDDPYQDLGGEG